MALRRRRPAMATPSRTPKEEATTETPIKRTPPRIGFLSPSVIERAFTALLYGTLLALVLLSVVGTYYGLAHETAPLLRPLQIYVDIKANTDRLWVAIAIQLFLTLGQYGARQFARADRRWWFLYLAVLAISVYYNYQAYWTPLNELTLWPIAAAAIVAGDVLPEFIGIRHE